MSIARNPKEVCFISLPRGAKSGNCKSGIRLKDHPAGNRLMFLSARVSGFIKPNRKIFVFVLKNRR
jgi:hypothetical protein